MKTQSIAAWGFALLAPLVLTGGGEANDPVPASARLQTIAILDFDSGAADPERGAQVATLLSALIEPGGEYELVERQELESLLREASLGQAGLVSADDAARVGQLIGADVLVTGRVFLMDNKLFIAAKIMGVETGRVFTELATADDATNISEAVGQLAEKIHRRVVARASDLVAAPAAEPDPIARLRELATAGDRPSFAIAVLERHIGQATIDPAVATELEKILLAASFEVLEEETLRLSSLAREYLRGGAFAGMSAGSRADVILVGEAFSEFATRVGDMVSCKARVELKAIERRSGRLLAADRRTVVQADLSEHIAAKNALQKAAAEMAPRLLATTVRNWQVAASRDPEGTPGLRPR